MCWLELYVLVGAGCASWSWLCWLELVGAGWSRLCWLELFVLLVVLAEVASSGVNLLHMAWSTYT